MTGPGRWSRLFTTPSILGCVAAVNVCCLVVLVAWQVIAASPGDVVISPPQIDVPFVSIGSRHRSDVKVYNSGSRQIIITRIKTSCGCTIASVDRNTIAPGKSALVTVEISPKYSTVAGIIGTVWLELSSGSLLHVPIPVTVGRVYGCVITPPVVDFGVMSRSDLPSERVVYVTCTKDSVSDGIAWRASSSDSMIHVRPREAESNKFAFVLSFDAMIREGELSSELTLSPSLASGQRLSDHHVRVIGLVNDN